MCLPSHGSTPRRTTGEGKGGARKVERVTQVPEQWSKPIIANEEHTIVPNQRGVGFSLMVVLGVHARLCLLYSSVMLMLLA